LSKAQIRALKELAAARKKTRSELIQLAVEACLRSEEMVKAERKRRALAVAGRFNSGLSDIAAQHDRYLVEAYQEHSPHV
jgi:predicted transcriptional regulator